MTSQIPEPPPPFGGPVAPPYADPLPGLDNFTLPQAAQEEFVRGIMDSLRSEMEAWAHATGEIDTNLDGVVEAARMLKDEAHAGVMEVRSLRIDEDSKRAAIAEMDAMGLSPEVIAAAVRVLASQGEGVAAEPPANARRAGLSDEVASGVVQGIEQARENEEASVGSTANAATPETGKPRDPFSDAVDSGRIIPGTLPDTGGFAPGEMPTSTAGAPSMSWDEGLRIGGDFGSLRERAAGGINKWANDRLERQRPARLPDDSGWERPRAGARFEQQQTRTGRLMGAVDALGDGAGVAGALGALSTSLARVLGPLGMAVGGFQMAGNFLGSQRADNMAYQQAFGGGQADAYGQRLQETMFSRFDSFGTLSAGQGAQLFRQVSALGMEGDEREEATGFALDLYRQGVGLDQSMRLIRIASDEGESALTEYGQSLSALSEIAKESGVAIKDAHQMYIDAVEAAGDITVGGSSDALGLAAASLQTQQMNTGLPETDYVAMWGSTRNQQLAAGATGMSMEEISIGVQEANPEVLDAITQATLGQEGFLGAALDRSAISGKEQDEIDAIFEQSGGNLGIEDAQRISQILERTGAFDSQTLETIARVYGVTGSPQELRHLIARQFVEDDPSMDIAGMLDETADIKEEAALTTWDDGSTLRPEGLNWGAGNQKKASAARADWGWGTGGDWGPFDTWMGGPDFDASNVMASSDRYFEQIYGGERDTRSQALEDVYTYIGRQGEDDTEEDMQARADMFNDATFEVVGEDGEVTKTFGMAELPNYADELETGKIRMVGEDGKSKHMTQVIPDITQRETPTSQHFTDLGDILGNLNHTLTESGLIKVEVEAKGDLADMLTVRRDGGVEVKDSKSQGIPADGFTFGGSGRF